eukprot:4197756-Alexandrium_andersonii.AAC.1
MPRCTRGRTPRGQSKSVTEPMASAGSSRRISRTFKEAPKKGRGRRHVRPGALAHVEAVPRREA